MTFDPEYLNNTIENPDTIVDFYDKCNTNFLGMYDDLVSLDSLVSELTSLLSEQ